MMMRCFHMTYFYTEIICLPASPARRDADSHYSALQSVVVNLADFLDED